MAVLMYMSSLKGVGSCSARCCVCIGGSKNDGPSKGEPGVSAARVKQKDMFLLYDLSNYCSQQMYEMRNEGGVAAGCWLWKYAQCLAAEALFLVGSCSRVLSKLVTRLPSPITEDR